MKETSARLLRLLTLLQTRRDWSGAELADRLGVSTRTVRRDVDKLRDLDYPVEASKGIDGGYRLGAGAELPPLQLDDEEAVAIAIGLRSTTGSSVEGLGETALRALVKLEQVLPVRLRHRVNSMQISTVRTPGWGETVDAEVLTTIGAACRDHQRLRFDYRGHSGSESLRMAEPHHLVMWGRRWYLVAWDVERNDWRTFRVDRMRPWTPAGPRFTPRELPDGDAATFVAQRVAQRWPYQATIRLHVSADSPVAQDSASYGRIEPIDDNSCLLHLGADNPHGLAFLLGALEVDFEVENAPELAEQLIRVAGRFRRAAGG
ncbi:MAG TPA: DNA-binding transcriptional regulator [Micromonosporaceae bacterium]|nr:DNA-binding transcriptional regulator [Micromonosporaceae bacterium]HCU50304.1 DNA-binding transcriptional regulator [Micromonosporaceae bacterium]